MDTILSGVCQETFLVYIADVIIFSRNNYQRDKEFDEELTQLLQVGVTMKLLNSYFFEMKIW